MSKGVGQYYAASPGRDRLKTDNPPIKLRGGIGIGQGSAPIHRRAGVPRRPGETPTATVRHGGKRRIRLLIKQ